jgi:hypothetical protein
VKKGHAVHTKPDTVGSGTKVVISPDKAKRVRTAFGKAKGLRTTVTPQEVASSSLVATAQEGGKVNLNRVARQVKGAVNDGLRLYREKVRPHVKDELRAGVKEAIRKGVPAAVAAASALTGQPQLLAAVPAASYAADRLADPAADALGKLTGAYGVKKGGKVTQGVPSGSFRNDAGTLVSLGHPAVHPQPPVADHSKPKPTLVKDPSVVKYTRGGSLRVN